MAGLSRADFQRAVYEMAQYPCSEFYEGRKPAADVGGIQIPEWIVQKCTIDPRASVPLLGSPQNLKVIVAGGQSTIMLAFVGTWGASPTYFVTRAIRPTANFDRLIEKCRGWESPITR